MRNTIILFLFILFCPAIFSQQVIDLYDGDIPNLKKLRNVSDSSLSTPIGTIYLVVTTPTLTLYLPPKEKNTGTAVILCPGGGYGILAMTLEGDTIAKQLSKAGIAGIVLKYRLPNPEYVDNKEIVPLQDAQRALILVRENAKKWGIDPQKVGLMGSSAGGHLASTIGTHFQKRYAENPRNTNVRPDFLILNYPVISFADSLTHFGSRFNLVGKVLPAEEMRRITSDWINSEKEYLKYPIASDKIQEYSNELHVTPNTPPTFIIHADDDDVVKIQNSILFIAALQKNGVEVKPFFYAKGGHGFGIDNKTSDVDWLDSCVSWLRSERWLNAKPLSK